MPDLLKPDWTTLIYSIASAVVAVTVSIGTVKSNPDIRADKFTRTEFEKYLVSHDRAMLLNHREMLSSIDEKITELRADMPPKNTRERISDMEIYLKRNSIDGKTYEQEQWNW